MLRSAEYGFFRCIRRAVLNHSILEAGLDLVGRCFCQDVADRTTDSAAFDAYGRSELFERGIGSISVIAADLTWRIEDPRDIRILMEAFTRRTSANQLGTAVAIRICRTWKMPVGVVTTPEVEIDSGFAEPQL